MIHETFVVNGTYFVAAKFNPPYSKLNTKFVDSKGREIIPDLKRNNEEAFSNTEVDDINWYVNVEELEGEMRGLKPERDFSSRMNQLQNFFSHSVSRDDEELHSAWLTIREQDEVFLRIDLKENGGRFLSCLRQGHGLWSTTTIPFGKPLG